MKTEIHYRWEPNGRKVRAWTKDWFGDQFEVMDAEAFRVFRSQAERFGIKFVEHDEDEE